MGVLHAIVSRIPFASRLSDPPGSNSSNDKNDGKGESTKLKDGPIALSSPSSSSSSPSPTSLSPTLPTAATATAPTTAATTTTTATTTTATSATSRITLARRKLNSLMRRRIRIRSSSTFSIPLPFVLLFPCLVIVLVVVLVLTHPHSSRGLLIPSGTPPAIRAISEKYDKVFATGCLPIDTSGPRANAAIVVLARNKELEGVVTSMRSLERHFNRWWNYPYVFLNDGDFDDAFMETVKNHTKASVEFGKIDSTMWGFPEWMDAEVAREGIRKQGDAALMYGGLESYHHMCRFNSGFFFRHPLLLKYEWYWRLEPDIKYFCDITYDPFMKMIEMNKTYGFTIAIKELHETVPNLFRYASAYKRNNNLTSKGLWEMFLERPPEEEAAGPVDADWEKVKEEERERKEKEKVVPGEIKIGEASVNVDPNEMEGESYNMCHFWSNFEIARLDWFRSKEYQDFFDMMDRSGGFWMERWGDAPIHSLAAGALLSPRDIHYFRDFGYRHTTIQHCPANAPARQRERIPWLDETIEDEKKRKEDDEYWESPDPPRENGVGCRCRCDTDVVEVEGKQGSCLAEWVRVAGGWTTP